MVSGELNIGILDLRIFAQQIPKLSVCLVKL